MTTALFARGDTVRSLCVRLAAVALAAAALTTLCGCPCIVEAIAYDREYAQWLAQTDTWPSVAVEIVNNTAAPASIDLTSAAQGPAYPDCGLGYYGSYYESVQSRSVLVDAQGIATGTLKCGEVLAISVQAPLDVPSIASGSDGYAIYYDDYGLYLSAGNCDISGVGLPSGDVFTGDTFSPVRYVRPVEDGLDCTTAKLVITIDRAATPRVVDPQTGLVTAEATLGAVTLSIE